MGFILALKMAIASIISNKGRTFLTMLGVIIGVAAVIAATGFAMGSTASITSSIEGLGANTLTVTLYNKGTNRDLSYDEFIEFTEENAEYIEAVSPTVTGNATIKYETESYDNSQIIGTNAAYEIVKDSHVQEGRYILDLDLEFRQKIAVIGTAVVNNLFDSKEEALGAYIKIDGTPFKVVGILDEKEGGQEGSSDDVILIPLTTAQRMFSSAKINNFTILVPDSDLVNETVVILETFLTDFYGTDDSYRVFNQAMVLDTLSEVTNSLALILGGIAVISLLVGGIGIMNIMLVSVTERTREIGIRKAIGAKRSSIMTQFIIEAVVVTGLGGLTGVLIGVLSIQLIISRFVPPIIDTTWVFVSFGFSLVIGLVFGIFPALKAANLNPIEALRSE